MTTIIENDKTIHEGRFRLHHMTTGDAITRTDEVREGDGYDDDDDRDDDDDQR